MSKQKALLRSLSNFKHYTQASKQIVIQNAPKCNNPIIRCAVSHIYNQCVDDNDYDKNAIMISCIFPVDLPIATYKYLNSSNNLHMAQKLPSTIKFKT